LLKTLLLADLMTSNGFWPFLVLFPLWGRLAASLTTCLSHYARPQGGLGKPFVDLAGGRELALAGISTLAASLVIGGPVGAVSSLIVALAAVAGVGLWNRRIGGVTGDILGATIELGECLGLLVIAVGLN
jgi:adenosylcobinamide-GDP ribazoletransferase